VRRGPLDRLAAIASLVFIADFATKQWALRALGAGDVPLGAGWHLTVVNNTHLAGGLESGGFELPFTALLTTVVAVLVLRVCRQLDAIDASAPVALGMLVGAGAANLADALLPPRGVVDFIAFTGSPGATTSFNVADVILAIGLALCLQTVWRLALTIRGRVLSRRPTRPISGVPLMRDRILLSAGHAMLAMCGFVWLYSMAVAWTPDAGRSAPNSLLCGVGIFALAFVTSQARLLLADRRLAAKRRLVPIGSIERVVLDGSIPATELTDLPRGRPRHAPPRDVVIRDERREPPQSLLD
jgi:lipoprotein signal peptidase